MGYISYSVLCGIKKDCCAVDDGCQIVKFLELFTYYNTCFSKNEMIRGLVFFVYFNVAYPKFSLYIDKILTKKKCNGIIHTLILLSMES